MGSYVHQKELHVVRGKSKVQNKVSYHLCKGKKLNKYIYAFIYIEYPWKDKQKTANNCCP